MHLKLNILLLLCFWVAEASIAGYDIESNNIEQTDGEGAAESNVENVDSNTLHYFTWDYGRYNCSAVTSTEMHSALSDYFETEVTNYCTVINANETNCSLLRDHILIECEKEIYCSKCVPYLLIPHLLFDSYLSSNRDHVGNPASFRTGDFATTFTEKPIVPTDKITHHGYHRFYPRFLDYYRHAPYADRSDLAMIEIGVYRGSSLLGWLDYFKNAFVFGLDDGQNTGGHRPDHLDERFYIMFGDQGDIVTLEHLADTVLYFNRTAKPTEASAEANVESVTIHSDSKTSSELSKKLSQLFYNATGKASDINEHLLQQRLLAQRCKSILQIGVASFMPTWAFFLGLTSGSSYIAIDHRIEPDGVSEVFEIAADRGIDAQFLEQDNIAIDQEGFDMVFIDGIHTYAQVTYELYQLAPYTWKYLTLHDSSGPWGEADDLRYTGDRSEYPEWINKTKRGVWPAISDFLAINPDWRLKQRKTNNNGFTILERIVVPNSEETVADELQQQQQQPKQDSNSRKIQSVSTAPSLHTFTVFLIVDDGSHHPHDQLFTFNYLFHNVLAPGGTYYIEDVETSYWAHSSMYGKSLNFGLKHNESIVEIFKNLADDVNLEAISGVYRKTRRDLDLYLPPHIRYAVSMVTFAYNSIIIVKKTQDDMEYAKRMSKFYDLLA